MPDVVMKLVTAFSTGLVLTGHKEEAALQESESFPIAVIKCLLSAFLFGCVPTPSSTDIQTVISISEVGASGLPSSVGWVLQLADRCCHMAQVQLNLALLGLPGFTELHIC